MCELSLVNLKNASINRKLFLIAGSVGSIANDDGWGYADSTGIYKNYLPMFLDESSGEMLKTTKVKTPLLGHVRAASLQVPVCTENSHPFLEKDIIFMHNGSLKPKNEKDFVLEYKVTEKDKDGKDMEETYKYSDSKMFFDRFLSRYKVGGNFLEKLKETMDEFYGKFAMMFYIGKDIFVVRGKTANLYISYLKESSKEKAPILGYVINTSLTTLDFSTALLSNMEELEGKPKLHFTYPVLLSDETVWKAGEFDLEKIGELKENYNSYSSKEMGVGNFFPRSGAVTRTPMGDTGGINYGKEDNLIKELHEFRIRYSLSVKDLSDIFMVGYGVSLLNIEVPILEHFFKRVVPLITKKADKDIRRRVKKTLSGICVNRTQYIGTGKEFPWMMWTGEEINQYLQDREKPVTS